MEKENNKFGENWIKDKESKYMSSSMFWNSSFPCSGFMRMNDSILGSKFLCIKVAYTFL